MDQRAAYEQSYRRILELVDADVADVDVPTCPGWTVKDVVAHLASLFARYASGDPAAFGPGWADKEIEDRRARSLDECLAEWKDALENPGDIFESRLGPVAVSDILAHEQDIRTALNQPGARDDEAIVPSAMMALAFLESKAESDDLPPLRLVTDEIDHQIGSGEPAATLRTSTFELFRALHGRRTLDQLRAMDWEGDPGGLPSALFIFGPTERVVEESPQP
ncbi:MAG: maleylpyruvate isomerase family mycothiol-dependent enzyme [Actinobacteria bacterium]|nr:maleylpyruvate isomerase family mycothiol-dependent enzyme [Actinomycetota bacterium]